eukprot:g8170.t1
MSAMLHVLVAWRQARPLGSRPMRPLRAQPTRPFASMASSNEQLNETHSKVLASLKSFYNTGKTRDMEYRKTQLRQVEKFVLENEQEIFRALKADLRKPDFEAFAGDIGCVLNELKEALAQLDSWVKPRRVSTPMLLQPGQSWLVPQSLGVVLIMGAYNYPLNLLLGPLVGALAAGNAVVLKPSDMAVATEALVAKLLPKYLDANLVAVVCADGPATDQLLNQRFDKIMYTGSGNIGRLVMTKAAKHLTPVCLELGGKCPAIVDSEVDLEVAAKRIVSGKFNNLGQTCIAPDYVLVHEAVKEELVKLLSKTISDFYGTEPKQSASLGRIINARHWARLTALLKNTQGKVVVGGLEKADEADRYIPPTVVLDVSASDPLMQEEIFGPLLPVIAVPSLQAAIQYVEQRERPLAIYVFTSSSDSRRQVIEQTHSGGVCINDSVLQYTNNSLPFGGVGASGMGSMHGKHSFDTFSHHKAILQRYTWMDPSIRYPPYSEKLLNVMGGIVKGDPLVPLKKLAFTAGAGAAAYSLLRSAL